jgi:hypothetical protein
MSILTVVQWSGTGGSERKQVLERIAVGNTEMSNRNQEGFHEFGFAWKCSTGASGPQEAVAAFF